MASSIRAFRRLSLIFSWAIECCLAEAARGVVTLRIQGVDLDSVFAQISIPTLAANEHVSLSVVESIRGKEHTFHVRRETWMGLFLRATNIDFDFRTGESAFWSDPQNRQILEQFKAENPGVMTLNDLIEQLDPELLSRIDGVAESDFIHTQSIWDYLSAKWAATAGRVQPKGVMARSNVTEELVEQLFRDPKMRPLIATILEKSKIQTPPEDLPPDMRFLLAEALLEVLQPADARTGNKPNEPRPVGPKDSESDTASQWYS